ncbi:hypothetical protein [uncultured Metabacillus sp.]|uniref:hypothetical protein n=1 Tax=uncultured Metabacillus sp. TaxID=2860135 RepID=UPI002628332C|nr:hypothetical protein [uncultured Metabacillus sp.]
MKDKIIIVSEKRDKFYDLSDLISEMMEIEKVSEEFAIRYFMDGLEGDRYMKFPFTTSKSVILNWITQDMGINFDNKETEIH